MPKMRRVLFVVVAATLLAALPALLDPPLSLGQDVKKGGDTIIPPPPPAGQGPAPAAVKVQVAQPPAGKVLIGPKTQPQPKQPDYKPGTKFSAIKLVEDEEFQKNIDQAADAIEGGAWQDACDYLQAILDSKRDVFASVEVTDATTGAKKSHMVSVKFQANSLLASLPIEGRNAYELKFGIQAKQLLDRAKKTGSREILAEVASRFKHTKAGTEANDLLATSFMDRGDYFPAALRYERLLGPDPAKAKVSDLTLFKAALAFRRAGDNYSAKAKELEEILLARIKSSGGLALANGQSASAKQVQAVLSEGVKVSTANPHDWPMVGGNTARNAQAKGSPPMLDYVLWSRPTFMDKSEETGEPEAGREVKQIFEEVLAKNRKNPNVPVLAGGFPVAANGILFYRTYAGITGVYLHDVLDKDGKVEAPAGSVHWRSTPFSGSLGPIFDDAGMKVSLNNWITNAYAGWTNLLYENSTVGTLTTDNRNVYAVDDLALPIPPSLLPPSQLWNNSNNVHENLKPLVMQNKLRAYNIVSGKIEWELGGEGNKTDEFANSHFLCAPITVGGKLYLLNEKNSGELRVVALEPATGKVIGAPQTLGTVKNEHSYFHDVSRRVNAIHLAYAEGILVCPTNAGEILGVDLLSQSLAWAYKYRDKPPNPQSSVQTRLNLNNQFNQQLTTVAPGYSNWKATPPVIVDGKVVFTAPDSSAVCCISLRDGSEIWAAPQHDSDLYLAGVFLDKVLIVGKNSIRAMRLSDGMPLWQPLATGDFPSGQGVASNNVYYLPLKNGEICSVDLEHWIIRAHNRASNSSASSAAAGAKAGSGEPPGNLVFYEGSVVSQTPTAIVAYPQLLAKLQEAETAYQKDPNLKNLLFRGELRLADGQVQKAVDDLRAVLAKDPPEDIAVRTKDRLYEAVGDLLQADFAKASGKYLQEYKELTAVPDNAAEQRQREAKYWRIVGQGREEQGNLVEAFLAYKEYGASPLFKEDGIPALEDPLHKVPASLWLRGRVTAMFGKATPAQRGALEQKIAEEWQAVKKKNDVEAIRQFAGMFDVPFAVGREARLALANAIIQDKSKESFLEAELSLQQLRVPPLRQEGEVGGKALEALARLELARGTEDGLQQAAAYYREINAEFSKVVLHEGKTGAELFHALAEDPRVRPYLEEPANVWGNAEIKHREVKAGLAQAPHQVFVFQPAGDLTSLMQHHRLILDPVQQNNPVLRFVDVVNNKERWNTPLGESPYNIQFFAYLYLESNRPTTFHPNATFRFYQVKGHLAVIQVGMIAFGIDLEAGKVLWRHTLYDPNKNQPNYPWSVTVDEQGRLWVVHNTQQGPTKSRIGQIGTVQATYVALTTQQGLVVLDPVKGTPLWTKAGLASNTEVFGDEQNIYCVETADGSAVGAGRCLRVSDGATVEIPDFAGHYRNRQRILGGRQILTAEQIGKEVTMRLYDVPAGKTLWKRTFSNDPAVLHTEDPDQCGVIERDSGKLILISARTGKDIVTANMKQFRVGAEDLKELDQPLLLDDGENYFVALNAKPVVGRNFSSVSNNFSNGTRCLPMNGWLCCLDHKGEFLWHGHDRYLNQMLVVEQFKMQPVLLLSSRVMEQVAPGNLRRSSRTGSLSKVDGKAIWWSPHRDTAGQADFAAFSIDLQARTMNMVGIDGTIQQHYAEEPAAKKLSGKSP
jgi:outer membrane protein assembly factor BamB